MMEEIKWTNEQNEIIGRMIKESEDIGYTQGYDDAIREVVKDFEKFLFELKSRVFMRK